MEHPFKTFEVYPDYIKIDNHTFERPNYISYSQWIDFWDLNKVNDSLEEDIKRLEEELTSKDDQISDLEGEVSDLESEVNSLENEICNLERQIDELESGD